MSTRRSRHSGPKAPVSKQGLKKLLGVYRFVLPYKAYLFGSLFLLIFSTLLTLAFPHITGKLVDAATGQGDWVLNDVNQISLLLVAILTGLASVSFLRTILIANLSERSLADMRKGLFDQIIRLPLGFHEKGRVGELTSRITNDITQLQEIISWSLVEFLRQIGMLVIGTTIILVLTPKLSLVMISTFPVTIIVAYIMGKFIRKISRKTQDELANANIIVEESLQAIQTVKAFTNEAMQIALFKKPVDQSVQYALKAAKYRAVLVSFVIIGIFGGIVLVLWYGTSLVAAGELKIGELISFIIYTFFIGAAVGTLGDLYSRLQKAIGASERIMEIFELDPEFELEHTTTDEATIPPGPIVFDQVSFAYPTRQDVTVLNQISFQILAGEQVALVGHSGSGKSTITKLLLNLYELERGNIAFGDRDISSFSPHQIRRGIGIVPQEVILFGGTIAGNIRYGKPKATIEEIIEAAKKAQAWEFIQKFPEKLETKVGERGVQLSGGQKQRVAIARALLKDPGILILDEATSSLDAESEQKVQIALQTLMEGRTTLIIAHRLSTIRDANRILVINEGKIAESGTHELLVKRENGIYRELIRLQYGLEDALPETVN